jgi:hypothetical protein
MCCNIFQFRTNIKFITTLKNKLIEFENNKNFDRIIFNTIFYKKILFPAEFGKLTYNEINTFKMSRDQYYYEDIETTRYFNKILNIYNTVYYNPNTYKIPEVVYI